MGMLNVRNFGAKGDGVTDDTAAIQAAFDYALAWDDPGNRSGYPLDTYGGSAIVTLEGTFLISGTLTIATHLDASRATLLVQSNPAIALKVAAASSGIVSKKRIDLPEIINTSYASPASAVGIGVKVVNAQFCEIHGRKIESFQTAMYVVGDGNGTAWTQFYLGWIFNNKIGLHIDTANSGYCNECQWYGGSFSISSGSNLSGHRYVQIEQVNNHSFYSTALEGDGPEFHIDNAGRFSTFYMPRLETYSAAPRIQYRNPGGVQFGGGCDNNLVLGYPSSYGSPVVTTNGDAHAGERNTMMILEPGTNGGLTFYGPIVFDRVNSARATVFVDGTNHRLGLGTVTPVEQVSVNLGTPSGAAPYTFNISLQDWVYLGVTVSQLGALWGYNAKADTANNVGNQVIAPHTDATGVAAFIRMSDAEGGIGFFVKSGPTANDILSSATYLIAAMKSFGLQMSTRFQTAKGAAIASTGDLSLGNDGNVFHITGTNTINTIYNTNWQGGSKITLIFDSNLTVKHHTAGSGTQLKLSGSVDFSAVSDSTLSLVYDSQTGYWMEIGRKV